MGKAFAMDLAQSHELEIGVKIHLTGNCYPPHPLSMVPIGVTAIKNVVKAEIFRDYDLLDKMIKLPEGVTFRGSNKVSSIDAVESLRLAEFVDHLLMGEEE